MSRPETAQSRSNTRQVDPPSYPYPQQQPTNAYPHQQPAYNYPQKQHENAYPHQQPAYNYPQKQHENAYPHQQPANNYLQQQHGNAYPHQQPANNYPQQQHENAYPHQQPANNYPQQQHENAYPHQQPANNYPQQQHGNAYPHQQPAYSCPEQQPLQHSVNQATSENNKDTLEGIDDGGSFENAAIRRGFIRKVYLILFTQLLFTFALIAIFIFVDKIKVWAVTPSGIFAYIFSYAVFVVTYVLMIWFKNLRRETPGNYICLGIFTAALSFMAAMISCYHDTKIVFIAMAITAFVCLGISLFAIQTKYDFTMCSGFLCVLSLVVFFLGISCLIAHYAFGENNVLYCVYAALFALLFGLYLVYDTQMVVGGRKHQLSPEEYIYGALQIYIDIMYIFLMILSVFGKSD